MATPGERGKLKHALGAALLLAILAFGFWLESRMPKNGPGRPLAAIQAAR
jgi:hypothetical protein